MAEYLNLLRHKMALEEGSLSDEGLDPIYMRLARNYVAATLRPLPEGDDPQSAVRELLAVTR